MRVHFRVQVVIAFILFLATAALSGIIGNRTDALLIKYLPPLLSQEVTISAVWIVFVALLVLALVIFIISSYETTIRNASNLTKIRDIITRNVSPLYAPIPNRPDAEQVARQITTDVFRAIVKSQPFDRCGTAIYVPSSERDDYTETWEWHSSPNESPDSLAFYVGDNSGRDRPRIPRGIAGETFVSRETHVVHFNQDGIADTNLYIPGGKGKPGYRSLICVAILGDTKPESLGVLCLYSKDAATFDRKGVRIIIEALAYQFSFVLLSRVQ